MYKSLCFITIALFLTACNQEEDAGSHAGPSIDVAADVKRSPQVTSVTLADVPEKAEEIINADSVYEQDQLNTDTSDYSDTVQPPVEAMPIEDSANALPEYTQEINQTINE